MPLITFKLGDFDPERFFYCRFITLKRNFIKIDVTSSLRHMFFLNIISIRSACFNIYAFNLSWKIKLKNECLYKLISRMYNVWALE